MKIVEKFWKVVFGRTIIALIALFIQLTILYVSYRFYEEYCRIKRIAR